MPMVSPFTCQRTGWWRTYGTTSSSPFLLLSRLPAQLLTQAQDVSQNWRAPPHLRTIFHAGEARYSRRSWMEDPSRKLAVVPIEEPGHDGPGGYRSCNSELPCRHTRKDGQTFLLKGRRGDKKGIARTNSFASFELIQEEAFYHERVDISFYIVNNKDYCLKFCPKSLWLEP